MEVVEDIVIVGAGIAGLTTSLGLHRVGMRSLVLEASDSLRTTGFAFITWTNAWKALDAVGIGDSLRQQHERLFGISTTSTISGVQSSEMSFETKGKQGNHEVRCVVRKILLEALSKELPSGTIRFSSKVVSIEESGFFKLVHLDDGTILRTKVLIGCDGVNSVVGKWLQLEKPAFTGRSAIRGCAFFKESHGFEPKLLQFFGEGVRSGFLPCDGNTVYWFFTWTPSNQEKEMDENPGEMKQFVLSKLGRMPDKVKAVIENTELDSILSSPLRYRNPLELLRKKISRSNVCVAGDALHPMTPDIGQGGCSALEDGVILARCLAEALLKEPSKEEKKKGQKEEHQRIEMGLKKYAKERKWRSFELISTAYIVGYLQQSHGKVMTFLRDKCLAKFLAGLLLKKADFDCGKLSLS
ncbi:FAD/NAD(P)-binding domain containing protein [Trema orientale]|uniref:FAD/NAD(P)-binding domain containing protein n=1 Tax=Trema orientale TaxID=63057 RepID=A0A2P5EWM8_TREOI|nr:FAD/NAD(P)-binding domain containing protein [Trema orientale]